VVLRFGFVDESLRSLRNLFVCFEYSGRFLVVGIFGCLTKRMIVCSRGLAEPGAADFPRAFY
jgi:hypothetical protein